MRLFSKKDYSEWQAVVQPNVLLTHRLSKSQLDYATRMYLPQTKKIIDDCVKLVNTTKKPDVFFSRLDMLIDRMQKLVVLERYCKYIKSSSLTQLNTLLQNKHLTIRDFIWRYEHAVFSAAEKLKTEKAKQGRYDAFFKSLEAYKDKLEPENIEYIQNLKCTIKGTNA